MLLAAEGFGDLLSRYKYLYLTSQQDRSLVTDVEKLRNRVVTQRNNILNVRGELDRRRDEREAEFSKYSELASERARRLQTLQRSARSTERRLTELQKDESRLNGLLASLERARRDELARGALRGAVGTPGSITTADLGKLDWPVEGAIVYKFGRDTLPSGGIIRWNGVGIAAGVGTPVKACGGGEGTAGGTVRNLRSHSRGGARQRLLLRLFAPGVGWRQTGGIDQQGGSHRHGGRPELGLRPSPALRDSRRESDRAGSDDLAS